MTDGSQQERNRISNKDGFQDGSETVAVTKRQEAELEVAVRMLRFVLGVTRSDRISNEYIRGTA